MKIVLLIAISFLSLASAGCGLFSGGKDGPEVVFAATEAGTPVAEKVTKEIGPSGGTLKSRDGRLTLTVPPNAVSQATAFSIQPISNKVEGGSGVAYRLQPDGATFTVPLQLSIRYDEKDMQGTVLEEMSFAYQDKEGTWHELKNESTDKANNIQTVLTSHFTDFAGVARLRLSPETATLRVGESLSIKLIGCTEATTWDQKIDEFLRGGPTTCKVGLGFDARTSVKWDADIGTVTHDGGKTTIYTAPAKKPSPNVATVSFYFNSERRDRRGRLIQIDISAKIKIIDRGYRVSGNAGGDTEFEGIICDPEKPFKLTTTNPFLSGFAYEPSSSSGGSWKFAMKSGVTGGGGGTYTLEGPEEQRTALIMNGSSVGCIPVRCLSGGGELRLTLTPLAANEGFCN